MRRFHTLVSALALVAMGPSVTAAQSPVPARAAPTASPSTGSQDYIYPTGAGLLFFYVRSDKVADFETIVTRLAQAFDASSDDTRRRQAASWQVFRSQEQVAGTPVFVFLFNPVVAGADYDPVKILAEAAPSETPALYDQLKAAIIRVERMGLTKLR